MKKSILKFLLVFISIILTSCGGGGGGSTSPTGGGGSGSGGGSGGSGGTGGGGSGGGSTPIVTTVAMDTVDGGIANGAANVSLTPSLVLKFSSAVNPATVNSNTVYISTSASASSGQIQLTSITANNDNTTFHFSSKAPLAQQTKYYLTVTNGVQNVSGTAITQNQFNFTTGDFTAPGVSMINPKNGVPASASPSINLQFSESVENVNPTTVTLHTGSPTGTQVAIGQITAGTNNTYTFSPTSPLTTSTTYYIVLTNGITDNSGNKLTASNFNFTTGNFTAPNVSLLTPGSNATGVSLSPSIQIQFSKVVTNVNSTTVSLHAGSATGSQVAIGKITPGEDDAYTFSPTSALNQTTTYYVVLGNGIADIYGNHLAPTSFMFTTGDFTAPTVSMTSPTNNASYISITTPIVLQFSEPVSNVNTANVTLHSGSSTGTSVSATITAGSNNTYTLRPSNPLNQSTKYYVELSDAITDISGNSLDNAGFMFTTMQTIAYIANSSNDFLDLCLGGNTFSSCITWNDSTFSGISDVAVNNAHTYIYVTNADGNSVSQCPVSNTANPSWPGLISGPCNKTGGNFYQPSGIAINSSNTHAYVTNQDKGNVYLCNINPTTGSLGNSCNTPIAGLDEPSGIALNKAETYAYITNYGDDSVSVCKIDNYTSTVVCTNTTAGGAFSDPISIALDYSETHAYIISEKSDDAQICNISSTDGSLSGCHTTNNGFEGDPMSGATGIAVDAGGKYALITDERDNALSYCPIIGGGELSSTCTKTGAYLSGPMGVTLSQ